MTAMKLELVPVPVTDIDRAKDFYSRLLGFTAEVDVEPSPGARFVQLTPPGSACSIMLSAGLKNITDAPVGSAQGLHLVVDGIEAARDELIGRGVEVGPIEDVGGGVRYARLEDPDGNSLLLQEMPWRTGDAF